MVVVSLSLLILCVQLSVQDLVTLAPSSPLPEAPDTTGPTPSPQKPKVTPIIRSLHVTSNIKYRYATTLISSKVVNPSNVSGEAVFTVTLPDSAFISEFLMDIKGKVYKAYVKKKEEAKKDYDQAVAAGQFAGHVALDARDSNQFTVSTNIEGNGKVIFNLTYEELMDRNLGVYTNTINLNPQQIVNDMSVTVNIEEPTAITTLEVPELQVSNEVIPDNSKQNTLAKIEEKSPNHKIIVWAPTPEQQKSQNSTGVSGQFIVKYDVDRKENPQQILVDEGYFVHFFAPEDLPIKKKHVVFVLDFSGSMAGRKLDQLKEAMDIILSDLKPADYFTVVVFQSYVEVWSPKKGYVTGIETDWDRDRVKERLNTTLDHDFIVSATPENIESAKKYLANYTDLGATNIIGGLRTGLKLVNIGSEEWKNESDPAQSVMVFLTDGLPNVEDYSTDSIINKTKGLNTKQCPIFSLAFGYGADFNFLRKLSLQNNGFARNIYEAADAAKQLTNFYKTIASPLLSNVTFTYLPGQVDNSTKTNIDFPIFFRGSELVVAGKLSKEDVNREAPIGELTGLTAKGFERFPIIIGPVRPHTTGHLEKAWAYLTIKQMLDKADALDKSDEKNSTEDKALQIALKYSFVTRLTSLVVVKPNETASSVDTTQVKPGSGDYPDVLHSFGGGGSSGSYALPASAGFPGAGGFGGGGLAGVPMYALARPSAMGSAAKGSVGRLPSHSFSHHIKNQNSSYFPSTPLSTRLPAAPEAEEPVPDSSEPPKPPSSVVKKVAVDDIKWLQEARSNSSTIENTTVTIEGHQFKLGFNETNQSYGACQVQQEAGECRHIQYCALDIFKENIQDFIPYKCPITGDYLGVCCPTSVQLQAR